MKVRSLTTVAGLFCVLALQAGVTAAATGTSKASTDNALQGDIRVLLRGYTEGPQFAAFGRGRFTMSGAISDHGRFVDEFQGAHPPNEPHVRTLHGAKGTIQIKVEGAYAQWTAAGVPRLPKWQITSGTKAYAGLRGRGTQEGKYKFGGIYATMAGTIRK
jgi:hypothetical protein